MKIKRIYTIESVLTGGFVSSFDDSKHKLEYVKDIDAYLIDGRILIHTSNIREVLIESDKEPKKVK
jgi:hypothetical protein